MNARVFIIRLGLALGLLAASSICNAQSVTSAFEKLIMPGRVISGHAEIEGDCAACHDVQSELPQAALCISCHEEVGSDRESQSGFHGRFETALNNECVVCHTDHEGRDADIVLLTTGLFNHQFADFPLEGAHIDANCGDCHKPDEPYREAPSDCNSCHIADDIHEETLGQDCQSCHASSNWTDHSFDHATTAYALTGKHQQVACVDCHRDNHFGGTSSGCSSCHAIDDVHAGGNGPDCQSCHSTSTWQQIGFNHVLETGFALEDGHNGLACTDCHALPNFDDDFSSGCIACHRSEDDHQQRNGTDCASCHTALSWNETEFDHSTTGFLLKDAHADNHCAACHKSETMSDVGSACGDCHSIEDAHAGQLGNDCGSCHQPVEWFANIAFDHDISSYPLNGMHAVVACEACHESSRFHDAPGECVACHVDEDVHNESLGTDCGICHTSNDWVTTVFDHNTQTAFALNGAHDNIPCSACHRDTAANLSDVPSTCGACHKADDVHDGQFGLRCESCHDSTDFRNIEQL